MTTVVPRTMLDYHGTVSTSLAIPRPRSSCRHLFSYRPSNNPHCTFLAETTAQYPGAGTLFYQTTAASPTTQHQADARLQSIYNYTMPLRQTTYHVDLPSATVSKAPDTQSSKLPPQSQPMQVLHINLDQPAISQADLVVQAGGSLSVQATKPQVTMEKLSDRYHIEAKHDGPPPGHVPPPPHLLSEGVVYKPLLSELSLHHNVLQISSSQVGYPHRPSSHDNSAKVFSRR